MGNKANRIAKIGKDMRLGIKEALSSGRIDVY